MHGFEMALEIMLASELALAKITFELLCPIVRFDVGLEIVVARGD